MLTFSLAFSLVVSSALALPATVVHEERNALFGSVGKVTYTSGNKWYSSNLGGDSKPPNDANNRLHHSVYSDAAEAVPSPVSSIDSSSYQCFEGDIHKYPGMSKWISFDEMFEINRPTMDQANGEDITEAIRDAIVDVSEESKVDARVILAVVMQESTGQVQASCTQGEHTNCGLMQAAGGSVTFDASQARASIRQMIEDGVQGTSSGPGLVQYMGTDPSYAYTNNRWPNNPFSAARCYNSGSVDPSGNLDDAEWGVRSYANDVANRLLGWDGLDTGCAQLKCGLIDQDQCGQHWTV